MYCISFLTTMVMTINIWAKTEIKMTRKMHQQSGSGAPFSKWMGEFLKNGKNKLQLVNLLADLIKDSTVGKDVYVRVFEKWKE